MGKDEINAFLGSGTSFQGKLIFKGTVRIDGNFNGEVESEGTLVVGKDARIEGSIKVGQMISSGSFFGDIQAAVRIILHKTGVIRGNVNTKAMVMEEGAVINGQVSMGEEAAVIVSENQSVE